MHAPHAVAAAQLRRHTSQGPQLPTAHRPAEQRVAASHGRRLQEALRVGNCRSSLGLGLGLGLGGGRGARRGAPGHGGGWLASEERHGVRAQLLAHSLDGRVRHVDRPRTGWPTAVAQTAVAQTAVAQTAVAQTAVAQTAVAWRTHGQLGAPMKDEAAAAAAAAAARTAAFLTRALTKDLRNAQHRHTLQPLHSAKGAKGQGQSVELALCRTNGRRIEGCSTGIPLGCMAIGIVRCATQSTVVVVPIVVVVAAALSHCGENSRDELCSRCGHWR